MIGSGKKPRSLQDRGLLTSWWRFGSIAAVHQLPARSPRRRNQPPHIAAAVTITVSIIGRAADEEARTAPAPAAVPSAMPTTPGGGGGRRQRGHAQRNRGNCNKREFA